MSIYVAKVGVCLSWFWLRATLINILGRLSTMLRSVVLFWFSLDSLAIGNHSTRRCQQDSFLI